MNLHEFQAKALFRKYGLPVPKGDVAYNPDDAINVANTLGSAPWVAKAQVHAGGRGKAGGVKVLHSAEELKDFCKKLLNTNLVTYQTDAKGQPVNCILVEQTCDIDRELYLGAVVDRACGKVVFMASTEGGVEIEKIAEETPEKILKVEVDPMLGVMPFQAREVGFKLGLTIDQIAEFTKIMINLGRLFVESDLSLLEVNPLVVTKKGHLVCLDGKINIDDNALYRHSDLKLLRDPTQEQIQNGRRGRFRRLQGYLHQRSSHSAQRSVCV